MSVHSEIDDTLRQLGSVEPPSGLERRINLPRMERQIHESEDGQHEDAERVEDAGMNEACRAD